MNSISNFYSSFSSNDANQSSLKPEKQIEEIQKLINQIDGGQEIWGIGIGNIESLMDRIVFHLVVSAGRPVDDNGRGTGRLQIVDPKPRLPAADK